MVVQNFMDRLADLAAAGLLAAFGGAASVLYSHVKDDKPLSVTIFFVNVILAGFVGQVIGSLIPIDFAYRDGLLLSAGFCTFPILGLLQTYTTAAAEKLMQKIVGKL